MHNFIKQLNGDFLQRKRKVVMKKLWQFTIACQKFTTHYMSESCEKEILELQENYAHVKLGPTKGIQRVG